MILRGVHSKHDLGSASFRTDLPLPLSTSLRDSYYLWCRLELQAGPFSVHRVTVGEDAHAYDTDERNLIGLEDGLGEIARRPGERSVLVCSYKGADRGYARLVGLTIHPFLFVHCCHPLRPHHHHHHHHLSLSNPRKLSDVEANLFSARHEGSRPLEEISLLHPLVTSISSRHAQRTPTSSCTLRQAASPL